VSQVALNWVISHEGVIAIPGAKTPEQAEENAGAADWKLSDEELKLIENRTFKDRHRLYLTSSPP